MVNIYFIIILATLIITYVILITAKILNMRSLDPNLPKEFEGVYESEKYKKSQEYTKENTKFSILNSTFALVVMLVFWFFGGFNWLDLIVRNWDFHPIITGLLYIGILLFALELIEIPFEIYQIFVIEEKYGFNQMTPKTFIADKLKSYGLLLVIGAPLLAGILAFFQYVGTLAWLYCWIAVSLFMLLMMFIAPRWIMPLFNKFEPLEDGELKKAILDYADSVNFSVKEIYVMDGSKRSKKSDAFFTGFGKNKRIALFDTLIESNSLEELVAVLAHEIGHYKKKHVLQFIALSILQVGLMFFLLSIFISHAGLFRAFGMEHQSIYAGFIFFGMLYSPISFILSIFIAAFSRKNEYEADNFAAQTANPEAMVSALKNLAMDNLSNLTPHPFYVFLTYSHPPILKRIKNIKN